MDVLCLYFNNGSIYEHFLCQMFIKHLLSFPNNSTTPRVRFAGVYDWYSLNNPNINVSSWHLHTSPIPTPYGYHDKLVMYQNFKNLNETIELKVKFVNYLFSEMGGVRENVTRLAVVFLQGKSSSFDERRTVPQILQQQDTDIKVFIMMEHINFEREIIHLRDMLLADKFVFTHYHHALALVLCNQCLEGWWKYEHSIGAESVSCYLMLESTDRSNYEETYSSCRLNTSNVVTIESRNELAFLQKKIYSFFNELKNRRELNQLSTNFYVNLIRDSERIARRFRWEMFRPYTSRPLVVDNWLPGKPSGGYKSRCVVWQFDWSKDINDDSNVSRNEGGFVDGYLDVDCRFVSSFTLCEASLVRRIDDNVKLNIKPATNESFNQILNKSSFVKFRDNIVSVSFNFDNPDFQIFLQQTGYELFPLFDCGIEAQNPRYISYLRVCNLEYDCGNWRDEFNCWATKEVNRGGQVNTICSGTYCCDGPCILLQWVNDGEVDCPVCDCITGEEYNDESEIIIEFLKRNETCAFFCNDDECIHFSQLNDGHIDCTGWEGPLDETIGKLEMVDICHNQNGHTIWAPRCVYVRDRYGAGLGCRDMSHLENCTDYECPVGYVKCPGTYCIPQHYVLDEISDCPTGEDEQINNNGLCSGNFACCNSKVCLHPDLVCNGHPDCPHKDDEVDCDTKCAQGFRCVSGTVTVSTYNKSVLLNKLPFFSPNTKYFDMSEMDLSDLDFHNVQLPYSVLIIKLSNCELSSIDEELFRSLYYLLAVDISYNQLDKLTGRDQLLHESSITRYLNISYNTKLVSVKYLESASLETLDLSHTSLTYLDATFLNDLPILQHLNLSFSFIGSFHRNLFPSNMNLQTLDLRGLPIDSFYENFFNSLTISQHLYTDSFELCCPQIRGNSIPYYTCHAPVEAISSCFDLIGIDIQRIFFWVITVLAVLGNVIVVVYRVAWNRSSLDTDYEQFVTNLGISDIIMGCYLLVITGANYYYRDNYILYDKSWRKSHVCKLAGFLATLSSESSNFFIFIITLDILCLKKFPIVQVKFSKLGNILVFVFSWIISFLLALTPVLFRFEINSSNGMCIGLPLTTKRISGWEFSFGVFIVLNFLMCCLYGCGYIASFCCMSGKRISQTSSRNSPQGSEDGLQSKQLSMIALFNFVCWFTLGLMGLLSVQGYEINNNVYAWATVIVLPIKSALNPILYMISDLKDKWEKFKSGKIITH